MSERTTTLWPLETSLLTQTLGADATVLADFALTTTNDDNDVETTYDAIRRLGTSCVSNIKNRSQSHFIIACIPCSLVLAERPMYA